MPLTLVLVECDLQLLLLPAELRRIGRDGGESGRYLAAAKARLWMHLWRFCFAVPGAVVFDCFAILAATHPHLLETERRHAAVTSAASGSPANDPRRIHLVASAEPADKPTREVRFCRRPLADARPVLEERLMRKPTDGKS